MTNEILPFAQQATVELGELLSLEDYRADPQRLRGNQPGLARLELVNTVLRQTSHMAAGLAQFAANKYAPGIKDNGDLNAVETALQQAVLSLVGGATDSMEKLLAELDAWRKAQIGSLQYFALATLPKGWHAANGDLAKFEDWPELKEAYDDGKLEGMLLNHDASGGDISAYRKFRPDSSNPTGLYLPDMTGLFLRNLDMNASVGGYNKPGLPNITGYSDITGVSNHAWEPSGALYGVLAGGESGKNQGVPFVSSSSNDLMTVNMDASKSSAIYGASAEVMPKSADMFLGIYLGRPSKV